MNQLTSLFLRSPFFLDAITGQMPKRTRQSQGRQINYLKKDKDKAKDL